MMKTIKMTIMAVATAVTFSACNNAGEQTQNTQTENPTSGEESSTVDIGKAMEGMPEFSTPEMQTAVEEWFVLLQETMEETQRKSAEAGEDLAKIQEIAVEMSQKLQPWQEKITALQNQMTPEDLQKFEEYGTKVANNIVEQAQ